MLPILMYNNMEGGSNSLNNTPNSSFNQYNDNIILNCVRNRKKVSQLPGCPVCSCTIRQGELDSHLTLEVERLHKLSGSCSKRKLSANSSASLAVPGSSTAVDVQEDDVDVSGCLGSDVYQAVIQVEPEELVVNTALLQLAGYTPPAQPYHPPSIQALPEHDKQAYDCIVKCMEHLAVYLKYCGNEPAAVEREPVGGGESARVSVPGAGDAGRSPQTSAARARGRLRTV